MRNEHKERYQNTSSKSNITLLREVYSIRKSEGKTFETIKDNVFRKKE